MKLVNFGSSDYKVSTIGLGGGQSFYQDSVNKDALVDLVQHAYSIGINYFDTAPLFKSEEIFGEALEGFDRSSYLLATKVGRCPPLTNHHDLSAKAAEICIENSLKSLRTNYIDLIQVQDFDRVENSIDMLLSETLPYLDKLRKQGKIRLIGLAAYDLDLMKSVVERSEIKIDSILNHSRLTLVDQTLTEYCTFFKDRGIGVVNASSLCYGLLSSSTIPNRTSAGSELLNAVQKAVQTCKLSNYVIERLANGYSYSQGVEAGVDVLLTGATTRSILDLNVKTYSTGLSKAENSMCKYLVDDVFKALPKSQLQVKAFV